jgi:hypothetical protein
LNQRIYIHDFEVLCYLITSIARTPKSKSFALQHILKTKEILGRAKLFPGTEPKGSIQEFE